LRKNNRLVVFRTGGNKEYKYQGRYEIWSCRKERKAKRRPEEGKEYDTDSVRKFENKSCPCAYHEGM
jgi:hypothetical protein